MKIEATLFANRPPETPASSSTRYHRAAVDGYVDMLCEASKRDANLASEEAAGLTPTLLAARHGHLEGLRILVGRGGDPERAATDGSSALHLAAARNHLNCVSFLVNFGVNMWSLDNELHTAKDVAAIEQRKEVLDYLDHMMAKQSALNTKNVQKLKEKAKLAAEKRLKQMRKAQLKAIKQVEKDERYLVKLSHNRRLLKAAHSLSDIKLVGRSDASVSYAPSDISGSTYSSERPSPSLAAAARFFGSQNKLHMDLRNEANRQQLNKFARTANSSLINNNNSDESAYGSSISSTSCYLSSATIQTKNAPELKFKGRPKYSDLVAMQSNSELSRKLLHSTLGIKPNAKTKTNEQQSLKSNSTIGEKLRGIGGVSRKVQLKRLLPVRGGSINELAGSLTTADSSSSKPTSTPRPETQSTRLCNVQPTIKLKLKSESQISRAAQQSKQDSSVCNIKWPPAPAMARANSEPDFTSALRSLDLDEEGIDDVSREDTGDVQDRKPELAEGSTSKEIEDRNQRTPTAANEKAGRPMAAPAPKLSSESSQTSVINESTSGCSDSSTPTRDKSQHHLLTQCLSQLKMRHESITKHNQQSADQLIQPSKIIDRTRGQQLQFGNSNELIQHQMNAGQFPLRPSIIKQHQHQASQHFISNEEQHQANFQFMSGKTTVVNAVDSIGSASSLAKRNSRSPSKSPNSSPASSLFYSSSYASSIEAAKSATTVASGQQKQAITKTVQTSPAFRQQSMEAQITKPVAEAGETISAFLMSNGLLDLSEVFAREKIDLEALMLLSEDDLKSLDILLGPRRKLLRAIEDRRFSQQQAKMNSCRAPLGPMYVMVDTPL